MSGFRFGVPLVVCLAALAAALDAASNEFLSTWKAPVDGPVTFAGRKIAAVLVVDDQNLRVSAEEALAREIAARGPVAVPAYRVIPREELADKDAAKGWFQRAGIEGLVILRLVKTDTAKVYSSAIWASGYYNYAWDYWGTSWASVYPIGKARDERTITVEVLFYDLAKGTPLWAAVTRTKDPKDVQSYMTGLAVDVVKRLEKDGLLVRRR